MNRIIIAEPVYSAMRPETYHNRVPFWFNVARGHMEGRYQTIPMVMGPRRNIRSARDVAIREVLARNDATHLLFLDDDILTPPDILDRLLAVDQPIVGGLIHNDEDLPIVFEYVLAGQLGEVRWINHPKDQAFKCAALGAGCMLIQANVLRVLSDVHPEQRWIFNYDETERSMDVRFCRMAAAAGFQAWCLPTAPCTQLRHY